MEDEALMAPALSAQHVALALLSRYQIGTFVLVICLLVRVGSYSEISPTFRPSSPHPVIPTVMVSLSAGLPKRHRNLDQHVTPTDWLDASMTNHAVIL
jgi:hypothetical protein